jgi:putative SOS response-associated peptidase YedK
MLPARPVIALTMLALFGCVTPREQTLSRPGQDTCRGWTTNAAAESGTVYSNDVTTRIFGDDRTWGCRTATTSCPWCASSPSRFVRLAVMCGRMTLSKRELAEIADELAAVLEADTAAGYRPRYNIAPSDAHPVVRLVDGQRRVELARWGFPPTGPNRPPLFNARADTAPIKESFRAAFRGGRCLVPADGFYEWRTTPDRVRQPVWIHRADGKLLLMAGLWEAGRFAVLTTEPNELLRPIHDRMPALLSDTEATAWLLAPNQRVLHPAPEGVLAVRTVSGRVNSVRNDDPECLAPALAVPRQLSLV